MYSSSPLQQFLPKHQPFSLKWVFAITLTFCLLLFSTSSAQELMEDPTGLTGTIQFNASAYRIGPGDVLSYHVYHHEDFQQKGILVRADGMASFNGVGELDVNGRTLQEIQHMLEDNVGELVRDPIVTVTVSQTKPGTIYLAGAVKHPGMYQLSTGNQNSTVGPTNTGPINRIDLRLSNILSNSGGVKITADLSKVVIKRPRPGGDLSIDVNLWKMLKEGDSSQDVMLQSGDTIYIPELPQMALDNEEYAMVLNSSIGPETFPVRVIGETQKPGVYSLEGNSPYLNSAIAMAGGYKDSANKKVIAIRRFTNDTDVSTLYVNPDKMDVVLRPNDIIFVGERKISKTSKYMENISKILKPFTDTAFSAGVFGSL